MNEEKSKMLKLTTDQIETKFGKGSIMKFGEGGHDLNIGVIPTGALPLDVFEAAIGSYGSGPGFAGSAGSRRRHCRSAAGDAVTQVGRRSRPGAARGLLRTAEERLCSIFRYLE